MRPNNFDFLIELGQIPPLRLKRPLEAIMRILELIYVTPSKKRLYFFKKVGICEGDYSNKF